MPRPGSRDGVTWTEKKGRAGHRGTFNVLLSVDQGMDTGQENPGAVHSAGPGSFTGVGLCSVLSTWLVAAGAGTLPDAPFCL